MGTDARAARCDVVISSAWGEAMVHEQAGRAYAGAMARAKLELPAPPPEEATPAARVSLMARWSAACAGARVPPALQRKWWRRLRDLHCDPVCQPTTPPSHVGELSLRALPASSPRYLPTRSPRRQCRALPRAGAPLPQLDAPRRDLRAARRLPRLARAAAPPRLRHLLPRQHLRAHCQGQRAPLGTGTPHRVAHGTRQVALLHGMVVLLLVVHGIWLGARRSSTTT